MFILYITRFKVKAVTLAVVFLCLLLVQRNGMDVSKLDLPVPLERVETDKKIIALTINVDWGEEYIPAILNILERHNAQVTFFVTGRWAQKNSELLKTMAEKGHLIENHGYSHPHPDQLSIFRNKDEIAKTEQVIMEITGKKTKYFAPPYGERGKNCLIAAAELGYTTVLWTLDSIDWQTGSTPQLIAQRILEPKKRNGLQPDKKGAIVLLHPKENTVKALPVILEGLERESFEFVTIEKLITF